VTSTLRFRWIAALAGLALAVGPAGAAGEIGDTRAQTPSASSDISVTLVEIPVEVTQGNEPVRGLTAADFEVVEGKRALPIVAFETVDLETLPEPDAPPPPPAARRHVLFLFDFALSRPERLKDGIAAARELVEKDLDPRDMVAVGLYLPKGELPLLLSFTTDRAAARRTLEGLEGVLTGRIPEKSGELDPLRLTGLDARSLLTQVWRVDERNFAADMLASLGTSGGGFRWGDFLQKNVLFHSSVLEQLSVESRQRSHVMTMADAIDGLAKVLRPVEGRKYLALFSEGFDMSLIYKPSSNSQRQNMGGSDLVARLEQVFEEMRRSGWVLHAVDIAGGKRGSFSADGLFYLANETGGKLVEGTNDLAKGLGGAMRGSVHSYLVGVQVDDVPFDGAYHKLEVKLRNAPRGTRVHHRSGYYAPLPFQQQDGIQRLADAARLVSGEEESNDLGVEVVAVPLRSGGETTPVAVLLEVPGQKLLAPGGPRLGIEVYGYALDAQGSSRDFFAQSVDLDPAKVGSRLAQGGVRILGKLEFPRGEHRLRVLVRDRADGRTSLLTVPLSLRSAGSEDHIDALFLPPAGDPWILVRPAEAELNLHGRSVVPAAQAALPASGQAQLLVVGHGLAGEEGVLRSRILNAEGKPAAGGGLELLTVTPGESGEPDLVVGRLSAGSLPPGSYPAGAAPRVSGSGAAPRPGRDLAAVPGGSLTAVIQAVEQKDDKDEKDGRDDEEQSLSCFLRALQHHLRGLVGLHHGERGALALVHLECHGEPGRHAVSFPAETGGRGRDQPGWRERRPALQDGDDQAVSPQAHRERHAHLLVRVGARQPLEVGLGDPHLRLLEVRPPHAREAGGIEPLGRPGRDERGDQAIDTVAAVHPLQVVGAVRDDHAARPLQGAGDPLAVGGRRGRIALPRDQQGRHVRDDRSLQVRPGIPDRPSLAGGLLAPDAEVPEEGAGHGRRDLSVPEQGHLLGAADRLEEAFRHAAHVAPMQEGQPGQGLPIPLGRLVDHQRQQRGLDRRIEHVAQGLGQSVRPQAQLDGPAGRRIDHPDPDRVRGHAAQHGGQLLAQLRVGAAAGRVPLALGDQAVERLLGGAGHVQEITGDHDAAERGGPHALRMPPQIAQNGVRAVGDADQVQRSVAEGGAHLLDVVDRGVGGVPGEVHLLLEAVAAGADLVGGQEVVEESLAARRPFELRAEEPAGHAGPAQVDEEQVALAPRQAELPGLEETGRDRGLAGPAREKRDRIGEAASIRGGGSRNHHDPERDLAAGEGSPVLEHLVGAAARLQRHSLLLAAGELGPVRRLRGRSGRDGTEKTQDGEDGKPFLHDTLLP